MYLYILSNNLNLTKPKPFIVRPVKDHISSGNRWVPEDRALVVGRCITRVVPPQKVALVVRGITEVHLNIWEMPIMCGSYNDFLCSNVVAEVHQPPRERQMVVNPVVWIATVSICCVGGTVEDWVNVGRKADN